MQLTDWTKLADQGIAIVGLERFPVDQAQILHQFHQWGEARSLPVYCWNPGMSALHQAVDRGGQTQLALTGLGQGEADILQFLLQTDTPGIFLLEGVLTSESGQMSERRQYQIYNAYQQLEWQHPKAQYWVLLDEQIQLPPSLSSFVPVLSNPLPDRFGLKALLDAFCTQWAGQDFSRLVRACQGLPAGEISLLLRLLVQSADSPETLAEAVLKEKKKKLQGRGLDFVADPDVPSAAGMELLGERLDRVVALLDPRAREYGLRFPRGIILWGPPGTGKSLSAKLAAKKMGVPLLASDWNALRGSTAYESERNIRFLLETAESMAPCVLYFDDFDKSFAGFDSGDDGGVGRRMAGKLLTWMQEHQSQVYMMATVNRLGMLPPELIRRFDDIYFVDLPHDGSRYEVFNLHLANYFPDFRNPQQSPYADREWRELLTDYRLCTPAEIANAVRREAEEAFYKLWQEGRIGQPIQLSAMDLLDRRQKFTPSMVREEDQIVAIRNLATYAQPVAAPDVSRFARPQQELFVGPIEQPVVEDQTNGFN